LNFKRLLPSNDAKEYRPLAEIVAELDALEAEAKETEKARQKILEQPVV
jgi:type I restriction enzyme M protein